MRASRDREGGNRRLRRTRLDPCPDSDRQGDGPARAAADQRAGLHDARLCHQRSDAGKCSAADGVAGGRARTSSTSAPGPRRCSTTSAIPAADGEPLYDVTYENVQAGQRTSALFRLANYHRALVVGTGDLSELALGWSTYGVGDQMSHYNVNASVPKTLIQFLLRWAIDTGQYSADASRVLQAVLETEISPELIPREDPTSDPGADSESVVGPYELQDFFLYYVLRFGFRPAKVAYLAHHAWSDRERGPWPDLIPAARRSQYSLSEIKHWLGVFLERFFHTSQFKRSALPNGPKVGSGGALSPRGDWRAPATARPRCGWPSWRPRSPTRRDVGPKPAARSSTGQQLSHVLVADRREVAVPEAHGAERLRGGQADDLIHLLTQRGARLQRTPRARRRRSGARRDRAGPGPRPASSRQWPARHQPRSP